MADIFISHSGQDSNAAAALGERLRRERPTWSLFYDKDNIRAGQRWQERLREELQSCRVVLVLLSRNWLNSSWCFAEAVTATFRGKDVVGIETEDLTAEDLGQAPPILHERQRVRLRDGEERPWQEILEALDRSGLDPNEWFPIPPHVGPYPGLVAFDEKDAGVFFGRKQEITEYLGILDQLRGPDRSQLLVISGASGSGKSSLLRAGLIPRLRRKPEWVVINPFEVAREPVRNLVDQLGEALHSLGAPTQGIDLTKPPADPSTLAQTLDEALRSLERAADAWVLLPLDQAEVLVTGDGQAGGPAARLLLAALAEALGRRTRHVVVIATIRTEFMPRLEAAFAGPEVRLRQAPLSTLGSLAEVIEKPAERFGIQLEAGLAERIVEDVRTADALPLLAYTLKALNDQGGADQFLSLADYQTLGGVQGAITARLQLVLSDPEPTAEETEALRRAFARHLIRVDEGAVEGERLLRRVVPRASLPPAADRPLRRLVDAGLLLTKDATIEVAHERLIDDWPQLPLKSWLAQDASDRRLIDQLRQRVGDDTLPDGLLAQAEELLQRDHELAGEEPAVNELVQRSTEEKRVRERRRRRQLATAWMVAIVVAALAVLALALWKRADTATEQAQMERDRARMQLLATLARRADAQAHTPEEIERAAALALESNAIAQSINRPVEVDAIDAIRSAVGRLPLQVLQYGSPVRALSILADGRLAGAGDSGEIKIWASDGQMTPIILGHGSGPVRCLAVQPDGRLISGGSDGLIELWRTDRQGDPSVLANNNSPVNSLAALPDGRLASAGTDYRIKLWPDDGQHQHVRDPGPVGGPVALTALSDGRLVSASYGIMLWPADGKLEPQPIPPLHGTVTTTVAALPDGRFVSGDNAGNVNVWPADGKGQPDVRPHSSSSAAFAARNYVEPVTALAVTRDGRPVSGGKDGLIKVWPTNRNRNPVVFMHGSGVNALAVLRDGRLASGGEDGLVKIWPAENMAEPAILNNENAVSAVAALPAGRLASGDDWLSGAINLWAADGRREARSLALGSPVSSMVVLSTGGLAVGGSGIAGEGTLRLWYLDESHEDRAFTHDRPINSLTALRDGRVASGGDDGLVKIWRADSNDASLVLAHGSPVKSLAALPNGRVASGGEDGLVKVWRTDSEEAPLVLMHGSPVVSLAALLDGRVASGGDDGLIKIWLVDGQDKHETLKAGGPIRSMSVLSDGRLASGNRNGTIEIWPSDGKGEPMVLSHESPVNSLAVLSDGRLASGGDDGAIKLWLIDEEQLISALCLRAGRNLTKDEWTRYVSADEPRQPSCRDRPSNWRNP